MIQSIKTLLQEYGVNGDIILYRDADHKKKGLCKYLINNIDTDGKEVVTFSDGAFGLYLSRALPNNTVHTCYRTISPDYGELMEAQPNLVLHPNMTRPKEYVEFLAQHPEYVEINQYTNTLCKEYYKQHFSDVLQELGNTHIDVFMDYGHSCATLAGFAESGLTDWDFIYATIDIGVELWGDNPRYRNHAKGLDDKLSAIFCVQLDTLALGRKIEATFPAFGNVYEATRSIAGAINYLSKNPEKTVLVYVGDSPIKEGTKFDGNTVMIAAMKELNFLYAFYKNLGNGVYPTLQELEDYISIKNSYKAFEADYKKYQLSYVLRCFCEYARHNGRAGNKAQYMQFKVNLVKTCPEIKDSTLNILDSVINNTLKENAQNLINAEISNNGDLLMALWVYRGAEIEELEPDSLFKQCMEIGKYIQERGSLI